SRAFANGTRAPSISPAPIILRSCNGSIKTISLQPAVSQRSDARSISRWCEARFSCSRPATTRSSLPNSCSPPDISSAARSLKSARRSWLARISGCSWEQPPCGRLGRRSRAGSRAAEELCRHRHKGGDVGSARPGRVLIKSPSHVRFRGQSGQHLLILSFFAFDAVDGAHSAASKCYRLVCVKARAIQGGEARKRRRRLKFEGIGEDMTT